MMLTLQAQKREKTGKQTKTLREKGVLPAVVYGPDLKSLQIQIALKEFEKAYREVGENALFQLAVANAKPLIVIVKEVQRDALSGVPLHADFFQPRLTEKMEARIPVVLEGEASAVKDLGGTLIKNIQELLVRALPQNLPHKITVSIQGLATFEDAVHVRDLRLPETVEILHEPDETVCKVAEPAKVEEELEKPIEEKVEEVERVEKEGKGEKEDEAGPGREE